MELSSLSDLLPFAGDCKKKDKPAYLADCIIRRVLAGEVLPIQEDYTIYGGIGELHVEEGETRFITAAEAAPTLTDLSTNFTNAVSTWVKQGLPVVTDETYQKRTTVCKQCSLWNQKAYLGLGKCEHKKCGCTKAKRWLTTATCPLSKWP